jgi:hypothetical protein
MDLREVERERSRVDRELGVDRLVDRRPPETLLALFPDDVVEVGDEGTNGLLWVRLAEFAQLPSRALEGEP